MAGIAWLLATVRPILTHDLEGRELRRRGVRIRRRGSGAKDKAPTLSQPEITPSRAQCWVPFSYETGQAGLYAYFRVGAKMTVPSALQVLKVK
jgi:predicted phage gp36 major capsid-like protein